MVRMVGFFGPEVPDGSLHLCGRCEDPEEDWAECNRKHFRYCCGVKGFDEDDWFECTKCGWWGYFAEDVPAKYNLKFVPGELHKFELLCNRCVWFS